MSASSNQPATVSALTGGLSMTTSAMPSVTEWVVGMHAPWRDLMSRQITIVALLARASEPMAHRLADAERSAR